MLLQIAQLRKKQVKKTEKLFCFTQQGHLCLGLPAMNMHNIQLYSCHCLQRMLLLHWQTIFPIWDKTQCIPQKEGSQSGSLNLPLCFTWEISLSCAFFFFFLLLPLVFYQATYYFKPGRGFEGDPLFLWHQVQVAGWA